MKLYFLRHGAAAGLVGKITSDSDRPLTDEGISDMKEEGRSMKRLGILPDRIWSSPLVRARQTAEIVAEALGCENRMELIPSLGIPCDRKSLVRRLSGEDVNACVMLVGHDPDMSQFPGYFIGLPSLRIPFKKGSLCRVDITSLPPKAHGEIKLFLHPRQLRAIHK